MAKRECPNCKSTEVKAIPFSELTAYQMGASPTNVWVNLAKLAANYTVYPWLKCKKCGREWRQWESPF